MHLWIFNKKSLNKLSMVDIISMVNSKLFQKITGQNIIDYNSQSANDPHLKSLLQIKV